MNPNMTLLFDESSQLSHKVVATSQAQQWHHHGCLQVSELSSMGNVETMNSFIRGKSVDWVEAGWWWQSGPASHMVTKLKLDSRLKGLTGVPL